MLSLVSSWYVVFHLHVPRPTSSPCPEIDRKTEAQKGGHLYLGGLFGHVEHMTRRFSEDLKSNY